MGRTIPDLLFAAHDRNPDRVSGYHRVDGAWVGTTWREALREIARIGRGLHELGIQRGDSVAILSDTRREWVAVDLAVLAIGAVTVGIYPSLLPAQVGYLLTHSAARVCVVENRAQGDVVRGLGLDVRVFEIDDPASWGALLPEGDFTGWLRERDVSPDDVATLIYTSGTTGEPKGAVLSHANFVAVSEATLDLVELRPGDRGLLFLPLAHSLQRFTVYRGLLEDLVSYFATVETLPELLVEAKPAVLASVPRMLEKIRDRALRAVAEKGGVVKVLFDAAFAVGHRRLACIERGEPVPRWLEWQFRLADRVVFRRVKERLGGELRILACGGAALSPTVARWYGAMGILVLEGWGLTETSAPATANREGDFRFGTVGKPIPGTEVRIDADGEILVRGPGVFRGYHHDDAATAAAFTDGWFRTGDIGAFDVDGFLRITDRKKELIVTAGGKNIAPVAIEHRLEAHPLVSTAVVLGSERPYLVALLAPDPDALAEWGRDRGFDEDYAGLAARPELRAELEAAVAAANEVAPRFEQVKRFDVLPAPLTVETGELTPTLKLKRRVIADKYADRIAALYG